jgi:cytidylate kinase
LRKRGTETTLETLKGDIVLRDSLDSTREESPLKRAQDAIELDTSGLTIEEQVDFVVRKARAILEKSSKE